MSLGQVERPPTIPSCGLRYQPPNPSLESHLAIIGPPRLQLGADLHQVTVGIQANQPADLADAEPRRRHSDIMRQHTWLAP